MKINKLVWVGIVVLVIVLLGYKSFSATHQINNGDSGDVKIGVIMPLTGGLAKVGEDVQTALTIAQEDFKSVYPNVKLIYEDDAFDPAASVSAFNKMVNVDHVQAIIGPLNGSSLEGVRALAAQNKTVVFTPWGAGNKIGDYLYKNSVEADLEARTIAQQAIQTMGFKKVGILYLNNDFGIVHAAAFKQAVADFGGTLAFSESFPFSATDFRTQLARAKQDKLDALYIVHNGSWVGTITKQAAALDFKPQFFGQYATEASDLVSTGGNSLEGLIYTFPLDGSHLTSAQKAFATKFKAIGGGDPQVAAYDAYDIYKILLDAISACQRGDGACVNQYISHIKDREGVAGTISLDQGRLDRTFYFKTVRNGALVKYQ